MAIALSLAALALLAAGTPAGADDFLSPLGPVAQAQRDHLLRVTLITSIAIVPVLVGVPWLLWRYRRQRRNGAAYAPDWGFSGPLETVMWGGPAVIIAVLGFWLWVETDQLDPYEPLGPDPLEVQAIGLDWKWLFLYPEQGVATLGELTIPAGRPVRVALTTDTVMQSFRIAALAGQIYAMPGMRTELNFVASRPGVALGENTQFNGEGFAQQSFSVHALQPGQWKDWVEDAPALTLDAPTYARLAARSTTVEAARMLGQGGPPVRFDLAEPDLFHEVIARYHRNVGVPASEQPGAPGYRGGGDG